MGISLYIEIYGTMDLGVQLQMLLGYRLYEQHIILSNSIQVIIQDSPHQQEATISLIKSMECIHGK